MTLKNDQQLENTKQKLVFLEQMFEETRSDPHEDEHIREVTLESLGRLINQFKEEIVLYKIHVPAER